MPAFSTTRLVEFADTDSAGIAHFASFFRYMESAEHELLRSCGYSVYGKVGDQVISFPRVSASCDYTSPARSEDVLEIAVTVTRVGAKSVTYDFDFACDGQAVAHGSMTSVCCRMEHGRPPVSTTIPDELVQSLNQFGPV